MTIIYLHIVTVLVALAAWLVQFASEKGTFRHRLIGYIGAGSMFVTAVLSFWITELKPGQFSVIHLLSILTIATLGFAIVAARRGAIRHHRNALIGVYIGAWVAFAFALLPGRLLGDLVFGG